MCVCVCLCVCVCVCTCMCVYMDFELPVFEEDVGRPFLDISLCVFAVLWKTFQTIQVDDIHAYIYRCIYIYIYIYIHIHTYIYICIYI